MELLETSNLLNQLEQQILVLNPEYRIRYQNIAAQQHLNGELREAEAPCFHRVITSYSIHYTKLYENFVRRKRLVFTVSTYAILPVNYVRYSDCYWNTKRCGVSYNFV